jgi:hypothetical protein
LPATDTLVVPNRAFVSVMPSTPDSVTTAPDCGRLVKFLTSRRSG